jgi:hypothetical protein
MSSWTTPEDVRTQVRKLWERGRILSAKLTGESLFPFDLRFSRPDPRALSDRFEESRDWIRQLVNSSKDRLGQGYHLVWADVDHRQLGLNKIPVSLVIPTENDALFLIGKTRQAQIFQNLADQTLDPFPELRPWLIRCPLRLIEHAEDWVRILAVLSWFRAHPSPGIYLRQMDVLGVHTKFIETRRRLFTELLDLILPPIAVHNEFQGAHVFEDRFGLLSKPSLVRLRILDESLRPYGLSDLSIPAAEFAAWNPRVRTVYITENEINGLVFPPVPDSLVLFGLGYGIDRLDRIPWLIEKEVFYWGDIDTHGFAILDNLRGLLPKVRSFLMDRITLLAHRPLWVEEPDPCLRALSRLTPEEFALYQDLQQDNLGPRVRLEQERIGFGYFSTRLRSGNSE